MEAHVADPRIRDKEAEQQTTSLFSPGVRHAAWWKWPGLIPTRAPSGVSPF